MRTISPVAFLSVLVFIGPRYEARGQPADSAMEARVGFLYGTSGRVHSLTARPFPYPEAGDQGSLVLTVAGSVLFGAAGAAAGGLVGGGLSADCEEFLCELEGVAIGFLIGMSLGTASGAHLGNGRRGNYGIDLLGAAAGTGIAVAVWSADSDLTSLLGMVLAVGVPVFAERASARHKARKRLQSAAVVPTRDGFTVAVRLALD